MADATKTTTPKEEPKDSPQTAADALKQLDRLERTTGGSGAIPIAPKQMLLDARDVEARNPDLKLRWVNIKDPQKAAARQLTGYRRLTTEEGGRQMGDELALFGIPKEQHRQMVEHNRRAHEARLEAHKHEVEQAAESVARQLRDRHGIKVNAERIFIKE